MKGSTHAEKEWLHKMMKGKDPQTEEQTSTVQAAAKEPEQKKKVKQQQGFKYCGKYGIKHKKSSQYKRS